MDDGVRTPTASNGNADYQSVRANNSNMSTAGYILRLSGIFLSISTMKANHNRLLVVRI